MKPYRTIEDVLASPWAAMPKAPTLPILSDRVLKSTRLEDRIYTDLRSGDGVMDELEAAAEQKLRTFPDLSRDVYQSFYSLMPRHNEEEMLSATARKFNRRILDHVMGGEDYPTIKNICEGRELPAYEAMEEFVTRVSGDLDELLADAGGDKGAMNTLEKLESAQEKAQNELSALLEQMRASQEKNETLESAVIAAANQADSRAKQVAAVSKLVDTGMAKNKEQINAMVASAASAARERVEETQSIIGAWSDDPGNPERTPANLELLKRVRKSKALLDISKYLGRFREIFAQGKKNGYAYGRGETYSLELGNDLSRAISSELAMLASPTTLPQFLRKYQRRQIKQYKRREPIYKGAGNIIVCLDESDSTSGDNAAWGKAVAMTLLEIAADGGRSFALIHFSNSSSIQTNVFLPGQYTAEEKLAAAETFLGGGTNFETPMREALRIMEYPTFESADIVFMTDGECSMPESFVEELRQKQVERRFTVTGILLDQSSPGMAFSLASFCQNIYRTSELTGDTIVGKLITSRI